MKRYKSRHFARFPDTNSYAEKRKEAEMIEEENVQRNEALRAVMDRYGIRVLEGQERNLQKMPKDFSYRGYCPVVEVRMGEQSVFCRLEELRGSACFLGKELWLTRFPDWEVYLLTLLLDDMEMINWYQKREGIRDWLGEYGQFANETENQREWDYACRAAHDLAQLFGEPILGELLQACEQCDWNTDGLEEHC
jgi:hypothetical protein